MLYAHAVTKVLSKGNDWRDGQAVTVAMRSTIFEGAGGTVVALDQNGDRIESYQVMNYVSGLDNDGEIGSVPVGIVHNAAEHEWHREVVWPGNTTDIPIDWVRENKKTEGIFNISSLVPPPPLLFSKCISQLCCCILLCSHRYSCRRCCYCHPVPAPEKHSKASKAAQGLLSLVLCSRGAQLRSTSTSKYFEHTLFLMGTHGVDYIIFDWPSESLY